MSKRVQNNFLRSGLYTLTLTCYLSRVATWNTWGCAEVRLGYAGSISTPTSIEIKFLQYSTQRVVWEFNNSRHLQDSLKITWISLWDFVLPVSTFLYIYFKTSFSLLHNWFKTTGRLFQDYFRSTSRLMKYYSKTT